MDTITDNQFGGREYRRESGCARSTRTLPPLGADMLGTFTYVP